MPLLDRNGWKIDAWERHDHWNEADHLLVPLESLPAALAARRPDQEIGVEIPNTLHPDRIQATLAALSLVAIEFPKFNDGRGFSIARLLRQQGYEGTLRAVGAIIPDQFAFALECGFDEVEISDAQAERQPIRQWLHALTLVDIAYQQSGERKSILEMRRAARAA